MKLASNSIVIFLKNVLLFTYYKLSKPYCISSILNESSPTYISYSFFIYYILFYCDCFYNIIVN